MSCLRIKAQNARRCFWAMRAARVTHELQLLAQKPKLPLRFPELFLLLRDDCRRRVQELDGVVKVVRRNHATKVARRCNQSSV